MEKLKDAWQSIVGKFVDEEGEYTDDELTEEEVENVSSYEKQKNPNLNIKNLNAKMVLFEPTEFKQVEEIGQHLKYRRACIINLRRMPKEYVQRTQDFLHGAMFALDGTYVSIAENTILCSPKELSVAGDISFVNNEK